MAYTFFLRPLLPALALVLAACTSDDSATTGDSTSGSTSGSTSSSTTASTGEATETTTSTTTNTTEATTDPGTTTMDGTTNDSGNDSCIEESTPLDVGESSVLGFSATEALNGLVGARNGTLTWIDEMSISDEFRGQELPITLTLTYKAGAVNYIEATDNGDFPDDSCVNRLEIAITVELTSDGGELSETHDAVVWATALGELQLEPVDLIPPGLTGNLDPAALPGQGLTLESLDLYATFGADETNGGLNGSLNNAELDISVYGSMANVVVGAPE